jgi:hypothetical protein
MSNNEKNESKSIVDAVDLEKQDELVDEGIIDEEKELTEEEKHTLFVQEVKELHKTKSNFKPIGHRGNITTNQFDSNYKKKRQQKNRAQKKSRKNNR